MPTLVTSFWLDKFMARNRIVKKNVCIVAQSTGFIPPVSKYVKLCALIIVVCHSSSHNHFNWSKNPYQSSPIWQSFISNNLACVTGVTSDEDFVTDSSFVEEGDQFVLQNPLGFLLAGKRVDDHLKTEQVAYFVMLFYNTQ